MGGGKGRCHDNVEVVPTDQFIIIYMSSVFSTYGYATNLFMHECCGTKMLLSITFFLLESLVLMVMQLLHVWLDGCFRRYLM
jgi:hypothetical protein